MLNEKTIARFRKWIPFSIAGQEKQIRSGAPAPENWEGYREFRVEKKVQECSNAVSLYLQPKDGAGLPHYLPGQEVSVRIESATGETLSGNCFLSDKPDTGYFRVTVDTSLPQDVDPLSHYLYDQIQQGDCLDVSSPTGDFVLDADALVDERPQVFIASGIGMAPLLAMAKTLIDYGVLNHIYFCQATQNSSTHILEDEVQMMIADKDFTQTLRVYENPFPEDVAEWRCDQTGLVNLEMLREWAPVDRADFFCCGPAEFVTSIAGFLEELGVEESRRKSRVLNVSTDFVEAVKN